MKAVSFVPSDLRPPTSDCRCERCEFAEPRMCVCGEKQGRGAVGAPGRKAWYGTLSRVILAWVALSRAWHEISNYVTLVHVYACLPA